jgi:hypothetical protein
MLCRVLCLLLLLAWIGEWPPAAGTGLYCEYWRSSLYVLAPLFVSLSGISLFPWQILLMALAPVCLVWPGAFRGRALPMDAAIVASFACVLITFAWGLLQGGSAYNTYYQLWRFLTALLVGLLLLSVIRSSRDLKALGLTVLLAALVRGTLCMYFYWEIAKGKIEPLPPHMTTHDDSLLFVAGLLIVLSWALARRSWSAWLVAVLVSVHLLYAILLNDRRLAWMELVLSLSVAYAMLPSGATRRKINRALLLAAPVLIAYLAVGWRSDAPAFAPVQALSTAVGSHEDASSLARQEEIRNLLHTLWVAGNPLLGTGWGRPYLKVTSVYANYGAEWWQFAYMPHNSLLGVAVFAGILGVFGIWFVVPMAAYLGTRGHRDSTRSVDRAAAMAAVSILPAYGAQCYGDIGFQSLTSGLILGVALATVGKVYAWSGALPRRRAAPTRRAVAA